MKTLFSTLATLLGACVLLSSCSQSGSLALTKRHYTKGYYVDISGKRETVKPKQLAIVDKNKNISAPAKAIAPLAANATDPNNNTIADNQVSTNTVATITPAEHKQALKNAIKHVSYKAVMSAITASAILHKSIVQSEDSPQGIMATTDHGEAHSLIWLIIVIILILWLIGILTGSFGIGILINLLLLIALILLILWLLWLI